MLLLSSLCGNPVTTFATYPTMAATAIDTADCCFFHFSFLLQLQKRNYVLSVITCTIASKTKNDLH